jgi:hypothetical protein
MWSAVETMTGNSDNRSLRSRLGEPIERLRSPFFGETGTIEKLLKRRAYLRKVTLSFHWDIILY